MKKRLKKKLSTNAKYELSELEELMILAHRVNQTKTGCVFIRDYGHVNEVEIDIAFNKEHYAEYTPRPGIRYGENCFFSEKNKLYRLKKQLIDLSEELGIKKD